MAKVGKRRTISYRQLSEKLSSRWQSAVVRLNLPYACREGVWSVLKVKICDVIMHHTSASTVTSLRTSFIISLNCRRFSLNMLSTVRHMFVSF